MVRFLVLLVLHLALGTTASAQSAIESYSSVNTARLLIEQPDLEDGDRITAWSYAHQQIGRGVAEDGRAIVVVRGDDSVTPARIEGARVGEAFYLKASLASGEPASPLPVSAVVNALTDRGSRIFASRMTRCTTSP